MPQLDSNGTARVGGGHRGVTEIVRSLESILLVYNWAIRGRQNGNPGSRVASVW